MTAILVPQGKQQYLSSTLTLLAGGKVYTYDAGTTNPRATYSDAAGLIPNTNPVILDARGEATIFWSGNYKVQLRDSLDNVIWTVDNVNATDYITAFIATLAGPTGSGQIGFIQAGAGSVARTILDKERDFVTSFDFGAKHDGVTDDTLAHRAGTTYSIASGKEYIVMPGTSLMSSVPLAGSLRIRGHGATSYLKQIVIGATNVFAITGAGGWTIQIQDLSIDQQQTAQVALSTNDAINSTATGVSNGKPYYLIVNNVDFINTAYRGIAFYGDNDNSTRELGLFTNCRYRNGSVNATNTVYTPVDIHLVNGVEAMIDDNDFYMDVAPVLPGGRCAVVVAQTQTATAYYSKPTIVNNRCSYRGCNELASLGAFDLYIWSGMAIVANNTLVNSTATAIKMKGNSFDLSVFGNKIDTPYGTGGSLPTYPAISINNPNYGAAASQFLIDSNQISNWAAGSGTGVISVQVYDGAQFSKNVVITNNQLAAVSGIGIDVNNCQDITISGNEIDGRGTISNGIRVLQCDGNVRILNNKISSTTSYGIYNDTPLTVAQDVIVEGNTIISCGGGTTYSVYLHCRQCILKGNFISGGFHGVNFGGGVQSAIMLSNVLANMTGTVGFAVTSTAANVIARDNVIIDSATISSSFADSSAATFKIEEGNSWNGQVTWGTAAPVAGIWALKDRRWNTTPNATAVAFWECTAAGTPGTWKAVALV